MELNKKSYTSFLYPLLLVLIFFAIFQSPIWFPVIKKYYFELNDFRQVAFLKALNILLVSLSFLLFYMLRLSYTYYLFSFGFFNLFVIHLNANNNNIFTNISGDWWYLNAIINKYKFFGGWLTDSTFENIPNYLSPLYFFVVGHIARIFNLECYEALLASSYIHVLFLPLVLYFLLRKTHGSQIAFISAIILSVFFNNEIYMKPYQIYSAIFSIYFCQHILPLCDKKWDYKWGVFAIFTGGLLFLYYFAHFTYIGLTFFIEIFLYFTIENRSKEQLLLLKNRFLILSGIFFIGLIFFILPQLFAVSKVGSSHPIYFGSSYAMPYKFLWVPLVFGFIYLLKNIEISSYRQTSILLLAISILFALNLFIVSVLKYNIHIFKLFPNIEILLIPFCISMAVELTKNFLKNKYKLAYYIFIPILILYSAGSWAELNFYYIRWNITEHYNRFISNKDDVINEVKGKNIFQTHIYGLLEYGCLYPNYLFLPPNIDYGSQASQIKERVSYIKEKIAPNIYNPAGFVWAVKNNPFDTVEYLTWDPRNKLYVYNPQSIGEPLTFFEKDLNPLLISSKYLHKAFPYLELYKINPLTIEKNDSLFLEKFANKQNIQVNEIALYQELKSEKMVKYTFEDIRNLRFYIEKNPTIDFVKKSEFLSMLYNSTYSLDSILLQNKAFGQYMPFCSYELQQMNFSISPKFNKYNFLLDSSLIVENYQNIFYGPFKFFSSGKYIFVVNISNCAPIHNNGGIIDGTFDVYSNNNHIVFGNAIINVSNSSRGKIPILVDIKNDVSDLEIRFFISKFKKYTLEIKNIEIYKAI